MQTCQLQWYTLTALSLLGGWGIGAAPTATDTFFASEKVPILQIEIAEQDQDILRRHPRKYVRATVREGETVYRDVGIHLKGSKLGSFRPLDTKPSLTLNFDKFVDGQAFHGMDKLYLNNSVEDPTYMDEDLGGHFFRAAGVPAPRTTHVRVELGGKPRGVYVLKQGFDRAWLKQWFEHTRGNLYEGGAREDIDTPLEKDVGEKSPSREDLEALAQAAQESEASVRWTKLQQTLDVERFVTFAAMEVLLVHWDGYCLNRNNYRLYSDPGSGKMIFIPHGMDLLFEEPEADVLPKWEGMVAKGLISTPEGLKAYQTKLRELAAKVVRVQDLETRITLLEKRLSTVLDGAERATFDKAVAELRENVRERAAFLQRTLAADR